MIVCIYVSAIVCVKKVYIDGDSCCSLICIFDTDGRFMHVAILIFGDKTCGLSMFISFVTFGLVERYVSDA